MKSPLSDDAAAFRRAAAARALPREQRMKSTRATPECIAPLPWPPVIAKPPTVLPFRSVMRCPKCGVHRTMGKRTWQASSDFEWIEWRCGCGFAWCEETAEAADSDWLADDRAAAPPEER